MSIVARYVDPDKLKRMLGITGGDQDLTLQDLIDEVEAKADKVIEDRELLLADRTKVFDGTAQQQLVLNAFPIVTVTSVKISRTGDFDSVDSLVENTGFTVDKKSGILLRRGCFWPDCVQSIQVIWSGGYESCPIELEGALRAAVADLRMRSLRLQGGQEQNEITGSSIPFARSDQYRSEWDDDWGLPKRTVAALMAYRT